MRVVHQTKKIHLEQIQTKIKAFGDFILIFDVWM